MPVSSKLQQSFSFLCVVDNVWGCVPGWGYHCGGISATGIFLLLASWKSMSYVAYLYHLLLQLACRCMRWRCCQLSRKPRRIIWETSMTIWWKSWRSGNICFLWSLHHSWHYWNSVVTENYCWLLSSMMANNQWPYLVHCSLFLSRMHHLWSWDALWSLLCLLLHTYLYLVWV